MNHLDEKYKKALQQMQEAEPNFPGREEFAEKVVNKIKDSEEKHVSKEKLFTHFIRPVLTAAAVFLIGLFLVQQAGDSLFYNNEDFSLEIEIEEPKMVEHIELFENEPLTKEAKDCLKAASNLKKMDRQCATKLFLAYKKNEFEENLLRKQKIMNLLNH